jgi:hypothetical protein
LSAAVTADPALAPNGSSTVSLFDHHPGQCRWIISDIWPVIYCGAPVQVVVDACGGLSARTEDAAFRRLAQSGVVMTSVASVAGQLAGDFTQPKAGQAIGILYEMASA